MPKYRDWVLKAALTWERNLNLPSQKPDETQETYIKRIFKESSKTHSYSQLLKILEADTGVKRTRQALSLLFLEIGITENKKKQQVVTKEKIRQATELLKTGKYTFRAISKLVDIHSDTLRPHLSKALSKDPKLSTITCPGCKNTFRRTTIVKRFCSNKCYLNNYYYKAENPMWKEYPCTECGHPFIKNSGRQEFCKECGTQTKASERHKHKRKREQQQWLKTHTPNTITKAN